jgi:predicted dehydrogenase
MRDAINHRILISGLGSIGRRHLANLNALGHSDIAFHRSGKATIDKPLPEHPTYSDLGQALAEYQPTIVFVCGPSHNHIEVALKSVNSGANVFIEKPLGNTLDGIAELEKLAKANDSTIMVGYMLRFHPLLLKIKELIDDSKIGKLLHIRSQWGEYLPDWHPWEDYRETYAAKQSMGGGPAITLSHEIDLALWFLGGKISAAQGLTNTSSELDLETEHGVDILIKNEAGTTANLHLDFYQRPSVRTSEFIGTTGRFSFDYYASRFERFTSDQPEPVEVVNIADSFDRNNMFISEIEHFFECIANKTKPVTSITEGKTALEVALTAIGNSN